MYGVGQVKSSPSAGSTFLLFCCRLKPSCEKMKPPVTIVCCFVFFLTTECSQSKLKIHKKVSWISCCVIPREILQLSYVSRDLISNMPVRIHLCVTITLLLSIVTFKGREQQQKFSGGRKQQPRRQQCNVAITLQATEIVYSSCREGKDQSWQQSNVDSALTLVFFSGSGSCFASQSLNFFIIHHIL